MFKTDDVVETEGEEQDFLLKLVRQIIRALADIVNLRETGQHDQALAEVQEAYRDLLNIDPAILPLLGRDALVEIATERGLLEPLALLLWEESRLRDEESEAQLAESLRERSLALLAAARTEGLPLSRDSLRVLSS